MAEQEWKLPLPAASAFLKFHLKKRNSLNLYYASPWVKSVHNINGNNTDDSFYRKHFAYVTGTGPSSPPSTDEETEAQRTQVTSPGPHSQEAAWPGLQPGHAWLPS